jgi:hypothetical protein
MAKAYWITCYRRSTTRTRSPLTLSSPALPSRPRAQVPVRAPAKTYEAGMNQRTVVTE